MGKKAKARAAALQAAPANEAQRKLKNTVRRYVQHILICTDSKSKQCKRGGPQVRKAFEQAIKARKLGRQVMVSEIGHIGGCKLGPNVIVYPEGVWYGGVEPGDVDEIIEQHILGGRLVERLLRGQRQDDPCGGCVLAQPAAAAKPAAKPARPANEFADDMNKPAEAGYGVVALSR